MIFGTVTVMALNTSPDDSASNRNKATTVRTSAVSVTSCAAGAALRRARSSGVTAR